MNKLDMDISELLARNGTGLIGRGAGNSAAQRSYEYLRGRIVSLDLPPNTVLSRTRLAEQCKVSQTPLREALLRLETEGLIEIYPQSRTLVSRLDMHHIREAQFLRRAVEVEAVGELARRAQPATLQRLQTLLTAQQSIAGDPAEPGLFQELDDAFHQAILAGIGFADLHDLLRARSGHLARLRILDLPGPGKITSILAAHAQVLDALLAQDAEAAQAAMREHLSQTISRAEYLREQHPDYFT